MNGSHQKSLTSPELGRSYSAHPPWGKGLLLQRDLKNPCPSEYKGQPVSWRKIAEWLSDEEGCRVTWQTTRNSFRRTLARIRDELADDPYIREWLEDQNIDPEGQTNAHRNI